MACKVLFVDDEIALLETMTLGLRKFPFEVHTALGGREGLKAIKENGPFAIVVSDFSMPEMDGVAFLEQVRQLSKDTVRMMLSGQADMDAAILAVNRGNIFRFLEKPCTTNDLIQALEACQEHHRLITAERELLYGTLRGSIKIMGEIIQLLKPEIATRIHRIAPLVSKIARRLEVQPKWEIDIATELCLLGLIFLPDQIANRINRGKLLTTDEFFTFRTCQNVAYELLNNIPRFSGVSNIIRYQNKNYDGTGIPEDHIKGESIPMGSRILKVLLDYDWQLQSAKGDVTAALSAMEQLGARMYDPLIVIKLKEVLALDTHMECAEVDLSELKEGMVLAADIGIGVGKKRVKILGEGKVLTTRIISYLQSINSQVELTPIKIYYSGSKPFGPGRVSS